MYRLEVRSFLLIFRKFSFLVDPLLTEMWHLTKCQYQLENFQQGANMMLGACPFQEC